MTDKGAVRFSVFISGYPKEAITGSLILDKSHKLKSNQKAYIIEPYPVDKATQGVLDRWLVERHAIFYIARFATGAKLAKILNLRGSAYVRTFSWKGK